MKNTYVDGFMLAIPKKNIAAYKEMAEKPMPFTMKQMWYGGFTVEVGS